MKFTKKIIGIVSAAVFAAGVLTACVPEGKTHVNVSPDLSAQGSPDLDFVMLNNDTMDQFDEETAQPYIFIKSVDIDGDNSSHVITITATAEDEATEEDAEHFASAILGRMDDAATAQYSGYKDGDSKSFGNLYGTYGINMTVTAEDGTELYKLEVPAGGEISVDPDYEAYEDEYREFMDVYADGEDSTDKD